MTRSNLLSLQQREQRRLGVAPRGGALRGGPPVVPERKERRLVGRSALFKLFAAHPEQVAPEIGLAAGHQGCGAFHRAASPARSR